MAAIVTKSERDCGESTRQVDGAVQYSAVHAMPCHAMPSRDEELDGDGDGNASLVMF
jgi:hypothetical protein